MAAGLLAASAVLHVVGLFPDYYSHSYAYATRPDEVALASILAATWLVAAALVAKHPGRFPQAGGLLAIGVSVTELGFRLSDVGQLGYAGVSGGLGLWLTSAAFMVGALGAVLSLLTARRVRGAGVGLGGPRLDLRSPGKAALLLLTMVTSILFGIAYLPSWDHEVAIAGISGQSIPLPSPGAFSGPGVLIAGSVIIALAFGLLPIVAVLWRPGGMGALLLGGSLLVAFAELISAGVSAAEVTPATDLFSKAEVVAGRLTIDVHLTGWYWFEGLLAVVLALALLSRALLEDRSSGNVNPPSAFAQQAET